MASLLWQLHAAAIQCFTWINHLQLDHQGSVWWEVTKLYKYYLSHKNIFYLLSIYQFLFFECNNLSSVFCWGKRLVLLQFSLRRMRLTGQTCFVELNKCSLMNSQLKKWQRQVLVCLKRAFKKCIRVNHLSIDDDDGLKNFFHQ